MTNYNLIGGKWNTEIVTWSFATENYADQSFDFSYIMSEPSYQQDVKDAFDRWEDVVNLSFVNVSDSREADIRIGWDFIDGKVDGQYSTLAEAWYIVNSQGFFEKSTLIRFDIDDFTPSLNFGNNINGDDYFEDTALHEIGHALGLDHYDASPAIMNAIVNGVTDLTQSDIDGVHAIYGEPTAGGPTAGGGGQLITVEDVRTKPTGETLKNLVDFGGVNLGSAESWKIKGEVDVQGDGDTEIVLFNQAIGRWATLGPDANDKIDFTNHSWNGDTRVVGIYLDPLVTSGDVVKGSPFDSQTRFSNDLQTDNISGILGAGDYNSDGFQEVYFSLTDKSAVLRANMHLDGNIQYANYQNADQVAEYLTGNSVNPNYFEGWIV